jgi:SAM-dependent methyltransferase
MNDKLSDDAIRYFRAQVTKSNAEFWRRMGPVDFRGKTVLDIGCGHGALSLHAAQQGASRVVGVDIDRERIEFARRNIAQHHPEYASVVSFIDSPLADLRQTFDIAISKDAFEHIEDLPSMMLDIAARLNEGGVLVTGFAPMYFSPFGDHGRFLAGSRRWPWLPVLLPESVLFSLASRKLGRPIRSADDVGLNKLTPREFRQVVLEQGWEVVSCHYNQGHRAGMRLMQLLRRVPLLEKYFTVSIYAQLRRPKGSLANASRQA